MTAFPRTVRFRRKHLLMLALAIEVMNFGVSNAGRYRPPGILVEQPIVEGHVIV